MRIVLSLILLACSSSAFGELQWLPDETSQAVFTGAPQRIKVTIRNPTDTPADTRLRTRIYQLSAATAIPLSDAQPWKTLRFLPQQTVLESVSVSFPSVIVKTRFIIQWLDDDNKVLGRTEVFAYPDNLLKPLRTLAEGKPLGVFDPDNQLKPLLTRQEVAFEDLENGGAWEEFRGRLAVVGPFAAKTRVPSTLGKAIHEQAKRGAAIVWFQPPDAIPGLAPSAHISRVESGAVVVAQAHTFANPAQSPLSQLNLVRLAAWALAPDQFNLPEPQP